MTRTIVESKSKTTVIGFDEPFCVIGERVNPTGRKKLEAELKNGDFSTVEKDALDQVACGATLIDVNMGVTAVNPNETEPPLMAEAVKIVQSLIDLPLVIDSSVPEALIAGLEVAEGRPLVNSVTGEDHRLEQILPIVKKYNVPVIALAHEDEIPMDVETRFRAAKKIIEHAADYGISKDDLVFDPLVMPVGAPVEVQTEMGENAGTTVFKLVRRLREELGVNTTCGASNISFGLPHRHGISSAFLSMAIGAGMTSAIMNPIRSAEMEAVRAANFLMNHDPNGAAWIGFSRVLDKVGEGVPFPEAAQAAAAGGGRRDGRRRRRA